MECVDIMRHCSHRYLLVLLPAVFGVLISGFIKAQSPGTGATNTPNFGQPVTDVAAGAAFGVISSTVSNPRIIQFAVKYS